MMMLAATVMGCVPASETQQIQQDQFTLRGMIANNQQQIDQLQAKVQRLDDRIAELEHNGAASASGQMTSLEQRVGKLESQLNSSQQAAGAVLGAAPPGQPNAAGATPGSALPTPAGGETASARPPGPAGATAPRWRAMMDKELAASYKDPAARLYRAGLSELKDNKYRQALAQFQTLQRRYAKSALSEPAEFFAANTLYEMGNYDQAILQFNDQTMRFPRGRFASAALLREAEAFMNINDRIDARLTLQSLLNDHPDSPEVPMAKSMMQTLAS